MIWVCIALTASAHTKRIETEDEMRIYVASSWRNETKQQATVDALRDLGHIVYDFRNPAPGDHGFGWRQCATPEQLRDPRAFRDEVLTHEVARDGFKKDMGALRRAEATVLVLPCGRSAHLELGYAIGAQQKTIVLLDDPISEPELMYLACSHLCASLDEVCTLLPREPLTRRWGIVGFDGANPEDSSFVWVEPRPGEAETDDPGDYASGEKTAVFEYREDAEFAAEARRQTGRWRYEVRPLPVAE